MNNIMKLVEHGAPEAKIVKMMNKKGIPEGERSVALAAVHSHIEGLERWETAPTLPEDLSYLHRLAKYGGKEERMKQLMARKNVPKELWDINITAVKRHIREVELWQSQPTLAKDLKWLAKLIRAGTEKSKLKTMMHERNIPEEAWEVSIGIVKKYIEDYDTWEALQTDEEGGGKIVTQRILEEKSLTKIRHASHRDQTFCHDKLLCFYFRITRLKWLTESQSLSSQMKFNSF